MAAVTRRRILAAGLAAAGASLVAPSLLARPTGAGAGALYLAARADAAGRFFASGFEETGRVRFDIELPARGHGIALSPRHDAAVFLARRPGRFAVVVDIDSGRGIARLEPGAGRWFNGHGLFSPDGQRLFATETDAETGAGAIGVYDAARGFRRLASWPSGGIDPHEVVLARDGQSLLVANGGIRVLPEAGRLKVDIENMDPTLATLNAADGRLLGVVRPDPERRQVSIRHLAVAADGAVAIAMQDEEAAGGDAPLVALHRAAAPLSPLALPAGDLQALRGYCGSAAVDAAGRLLGVTSPRGNRAVFWDLRAERFLGALALADGCGIACGAGPGEFVLTSGLGEVVRFAPVAGVRRDLSTLPGARWDNHLVRATVS